MDKVKLINTVVSQNNLSLGKLKFTQKGVSVMKKIADYDFGLYRAIDDHYHLVYKSNSFLYSWNLTHSTGPIITRKLKFTAEEISKYDMNGDSSVQRIVSPGLRWEPDVFTVKSEKIHTDFLSKNLVTFKHFAEKQLSLADTYGRGFIDTIHLSESKNIAMTVLKKGLILVSDNSDVVIQIFNN